MRELVQSRCLLIASYGHGFNILVRRIRDEFEALQVYRVITRLESACDTYFNSRVILKSTLKAWLKWLLDLIYVSHALRSLGSHD